MKDYYCNGVKVELRNCETTLLQEIGIKELKRKDIAKTYALAMKSSECDRIDWAKVNRAIISRWSMYALGYIKNLAWSGKCFESEDE